MSEPAPHAEFSLRKLTGHIVNITFRDANKTPIQARLVDRYWPGDSSAWLVVEYRGQGGERFGEMVPLAEIANVRWVIEEAADAS